MSKGSRIGRIISAVFNSITACACGIKALVLFSEAAALESKKMSSEREWSSVNNFFVGMGQGIAQGVGAIFFWITLGAVAGLIFVLLSKKSEEKTNGYSNAKSVTLLVFSYFTTIIAFLLSILFLCLF